MAAKAPPAFTKGQEVLIIGWDTKIPATVTEDSDKTHTMVQPEARGDRAERLLRAKPWRVLNAQLQAA